MCQLSWRENGWVLGYCFSMCRDRTLKLVISVLSFSSGVLMQLEKLTGLQTPGPGAARRLGEDCPVCSFHLWVIPAPAVRECEDAELPPAVEAYDGRESE